MMTWPCSLAFFGFTAGGDPLRVVEVDAQQGFNMSDAQLGVVFGLSYVPGIACVGIGLIVDRVGVSFCVGMFTAILLLGTILQAVSGQAMLGGWFGQLTRAAASISSYPLLLVARLVQSVGSEGNADARFSSALTAAKPGMFLCHDAFLTLWWSHALAFGVSCWIAVSACLLCGSRAHRLLQSELLGDIFSFLALPSMATLSGWVGVFWAGVGFVGLCCIGAALLTANERIAAPKRKQQQQQQNATAEGSEPSLSRDPCSLASHSAAYSPRLALRSFRRPYWVAVLLNLLLFGLEWYERARVCVWRPFDAPQDRVQLRRGPAAPIL